jgi:hypothetical protein
MPSFADLQEFDDALIRKGLQGSIFVKPWVDGDTEITALTDATGLLAIPTGYTDVGRITKDQGATWTRDVETADVTSLGATQPTRRDITADVRGLQFTMQESKRQVFELYEGQDLSGVTYDANGNVSWDTPDRPANIYYRVLALFKDGDGADARYFAKWLPRVQVTDRGEQVWNEESEIQYSVTLTGFVDAAFGTALRNLRASSTANMAAEGFTAETP